MSSDVSCMSSSDTKGQHTGVREAMLGRWHPLPEATTTKDQGEVSYDTYWFYIVTYRPFIRQAVGLTINKVVSEKTGINALCQCVRVGLVKYIYTSVIKCHFLYTCRLFSSGGVQ